jgi:hypothetical protein
VPTAAALYGTQAGNGAIVISTKKGHKGRFDVFVNSGIGIERALALPQFQDQYGQGNSGLIAIRLLPKRSQLGCENARSELHVDYLYKPGHLHGPEE